MPQNFWTAVDGIVLGRRDRFQVARVVALQAGNECYADAAGEVGIFAIGFLAASPARVAKDIDIGRPKGEAVVASGVSMLDCIIVFGACFGGDHIGDAMDQIGIPGGGETDGLGENGCISGARDAVQTLVPPVVGGDAQARNRWRDVLHLRNLFFKSHARDQIVYTFLGGQAGVQIRSARHLVHGRSGPNLCRGGPSTQ